MKAALLTVTAVALLAPGTPRAGMQVAPVIVEIDGRAPSTVVTVRNTGKTTMRYQVSALAWTEAAGEAKLEPTQELAAFPPLFQIAAGKEQKIRVGATVPTGAVERAWRLFIEELPSEDRGRRALVQFRTRFALPVFQAPALPQPGGSASLELRGGKLTASVQSTGNVHLRPEMTVELRGSDGARLGSVDVVPATVLAGTDKAFEVPVPAELCAATRGATLVAALPSGKLEAALALPAGVCAP
jgi:fimbrial chaperone protein